MKRFFLGCMVALGLASCSNDEVVLEQNDATKINYDVTAASGYSRAADVYCNNNMPGQFKVYAVSDGKAFINGDQIVNTGSATSPTWENQSASRYWPDTPVDFFAQVNGDDYFNFDITAPTFSNFTVNPSVGAQTDLLYAVKTAQQKAATGTTQPAVALNFHHALSQIVFYAKNTNPSIYVEVSGVSVCGVKDGGTYTLPTTDTDANIAHGTPTETAPNGGQGTWALATTTGSYTVDLASAVALKGDKTAPVVMNLTDNTNTTTGLGHGDGTDAFGSAMLLVPQDLTALQLTEGQGDIDESTASGVYFKVKCTIYNVVDPSAADLTDNVKLWDNKEIYIPVSGTWKEGMKYAYTLVFGDGDGGWDPHGPKPVMVPITFTVSVDEFIPVTGSDYDVDMDTK